MMQASLLVLAAFLFLPVMAQAQFWELRKPKTFPTTRSGHAMAYDAKRSATLLFGGSVSGNDLGDTWQWDGKDWMQLKPALSPSARSRAAMAYDSARGRIVLFGGLSKSKALQGTWEWDGKTWTQMKPKTSPPSRSGARMAFDPLRKVMLLIGGSSGSTARQDSWEWDGKVWTEIKPTVQPSYEGAGLVFDVVRKKILLQDWLGSSTHSWEWSGKDWTALKPLTTPTVGNRIGMVYDSTRKKAHLYGKNSKTSAMESWEWNGQDWTQVQSVGGPSLGLQSLSWDGARSRIVLFGGKSGHETWELHLHAQSIKSIGKGCPGSNKMTPTLAGSGDPKPGGIVSFKIEKALPLMPLVFVFGFDKVNFDLKAIGAPGCVLLANTHSLIPGQADLNGRWQTIGVRVPMNPVLVGGRYWTQVLAYDPKANSIGLTITNALETTVGY